jgi:molecular chaperone GrpE|tara:strand:+ start:731 stop:1321 length:591 start_codon:yes stop_codon:yes gene_type:complete
VSKDQEENQLSDDQQNTAEQHEIDEISGAPEEEMAAGDVGQADDEVEAEGEQLAEAKDQLLRSIAEMENVRRRAQRDVENAHKFAVEKLLADLFPVVDSMEKAIETSENSELGEGAKAIADGLSLSLKLFVDTLAKAGVEQIDPLGQPFDPQFHEAMAMVPNPDAEPNSVMDVMQKGYVLNGRLTRAAKVIVVKAS